LYQYKQYGSAFSGATMDQHAIDAARASAAPAHRWLPKDITQARLDEVRSSLLAANDPISAEAIAADLGISRVTSRRYLEYLVTLGEASWNSVVAGRGRPSKVYEVGHAPPIEDGGRDHRTSSPSDS
jgi:response regulator of citrate/malate metabolism